MVQRQKRLTKREKKSANPGAHQHDDEKHIHCISCGKHLDAEEFSGSTATALYVTCQHGSRFPSCKGCEVETRARLAEHDRTGQPPRVAGAWH